MQVPVAAAVAAAATVALGRWCSRTVSLGGLPNVGEAGADTFRLGDAARLCHGGVLEEVQGL